MKKLLFIAVAISLMAVPASARPFVLWDQYAPNFDEGAYNDFDSGCGGFNPLSAFQANDVSFAENVTISSITTVYDYYNDPGQDLVNWCTEAYLMIIPKGDDIPVFADSDPRNFLTVPVTVTVVNIDGTDCQELTASGLSIDLAAGDYWVSLNPIAMTPIGFTNQHRISATQVGDGLLYGTFCAGGPWYAGIDLLGYVADSTLLIEGYNDIVANEDATMGSVKALYR